MVFSPKLFTCLKNYSKAQFSADAMAGVIVGIVALPLAIAFGIASGVGPTEGLVTAIIAGFIISFLGGSKVQIGGNAQRKKEYLAIYADITKQNETLIAYLVQQNNRKKTDKLLTATSNRTIHKSENLTAAYSRWRNSALGKRYSEENKTEQ